jgi:hypothetical protein
MWKKDIESFLPQLPNIKMHNPGGYIIIGEIITFCIKESRHDILLNSEFLLNEMTNEQIYMYNIPDMHYDIANFLLENVKRDVSEIWRIVYTCKHDKIIDLLDLFFCMYPQSNGKDLFDDIANRSQHTRDNNMCMHVVTEKLLQYNYQPSSLFIKRTIDEHRTDILKLFVNYNIDIKKNIKQKCDDEFIDLLCNQLNISITDYILLKN